MSEKQLYSTSFLCIYQCFILFCRKASVVHVIQKIQIQKIQRYRKKPFASVINTHFDEHS